MPLQTKEEKAAYAREWRKRNPGYQVAWNKAHPENRKRTFHKSYLKHRERILAKIKEAYAKNPEIKRAKSRERNKKIKLECLQHYSGNPIPFCKCCNELNIDFLQIDHINGGGLKHKQTLKSELGIKSIGGRFYEILKRKGYPPGLQVLCANCNYSKRDKKYCVHELERGIDMNGNVIKSI